MYPKSLSADAASWLQSWFCYFLVNEFTEMESVNRSSVPNQRRDIGAASHIFEDRCRLRSTWPEPGSNESWSDQYPVTFKTVNQSCSGFRAAKEREKHLTVWWYRQEGQGWLAVAEAATKKKRAKCHCDTVTDIIQCHEQEKWVLIHIEMQRSRCFSYFHTAKTQASTGSKEISMIACLMIPEKIFPLSYLTVRAVCAEVVSSQRHLCSLL